MTSGNPNPFHCPYCTASGQPYILMRFIMFEDTWMNVSALETTYNKSTIIRTQRRKVRTSIWRCAYGHQHQHIPA